jgi:hypothetical protein
MAKGVRGSLFLDSTTNRGVSVDPTLGDAGALTPPLATQVR